MGIEMGNGPAISVRSVAGRLVVQDVGPNQTEVKPGDIVVAIDGKSAESRIRQLLELIPHSTEQGGLEWADALALRGTTATAKLTIRRPDGVEVKVAAERIGWVPPKRHPKLKMTEEGFGYIDLAQIGDEELDEALRAVKIPVA
jgi:hypothetical protein